MKMTPLLDFGVMRLALLFLALLFVLLAPEKNVQVALEWPLIVPTLLLPACAPLVMMIVLLDLMMVRIMSGSAESDAEKKRLSLIMWANLLAAILLAVAWTPFFLSFGAAAI